MVVWSDRAMLVCGDGKGNSYFFGSFPEDRVLWSDKAIALYKAGDFQAGIEALTKALAFEREDVSANSYRSRCYRIGDTEVAATYEERTFKYGTFKYGDDETARAATELEQRPRVIPRHRLLPRGAARRAAFATVSLAIALADLAVGQDYDRWSEMEMEHYRHFQLKIIGREPTAESFAQGLVFIRPHYEELPGSEAYRICYAQAISGFPASAENARLHVHALEILGTLDCDYFSEYAHLGVLLMNVLERLSEDRVLLTEEALTDEVERAFRRVNSVATSIFSYSLERGFWHKTKPGHEDWSIRPGMIERRAALASLPPGERAALPDWQIMDRETWITEATRALPALKPVVLEGGSYRPRAASSKGTAGAPDSATIWITPDSLRW